jgi:hypothetical protein
VYDCYQITITSGAFGYSHTQHDYLRRRCRGERSISIWQQSSDTESHNYENAGVVMSDQAFDKKVKKFRDDVLNGRKSAVAAAIAYPARAYVGKQKFALRSSGDLIRYYDKIFSLKMIQAIRKAETHNLFSRDQGVMLGGGEVWFNDQAKVIAFNNMM